MLVGRRTLWPTTLRTSLRKLSSSTISPLGIGSRGCLCVTQEKGAPEVKIEVVTGWEDDSTIVGIRDDLGMSMIINKQNNTINLNLKKISHQQFTENEISSILTTPYVIQLSTPENFDMNILLQKGDVKISGTKLASENCNIITKNGSIDANKIRANNLSLYAPKGYINIHNVADGTIIDIKSQSLSAKRLGAVDHININADASSFSSNSFSNNDDQMYQDKDHNFSMTSLTKEFYENSKHKSLVLINSLYSPSTKIICTGNSKLFIKNNIPTSSTSTSTSSQSSTSTSRQDNNRIESSSLPPMVLVDSMHGAIDIDVYGYCNKIYDKALSVQRVSGSVKGFVYKTKNEINQMKILNNKDNIDEYIDNDNVDDDDKDNDDGGGDIEVHYDVIENDSYLRTFGSGNILLFMNQEIMARLNLQTHKKGKIEIGNNERFAYQTNDKDNKQSEKEVLSLKQSEKENQSDLNKNIKAMEKGYITGFVRPMGKREDLIPIPGTGVGKIDLEAASRFKITTSFFGQQDRGKDEHRNDISNHNDNNNNEMESATTFLSLEGSSNNSNHIPPLPSVTCDAGDGGNIIFESLSWKDSIKRKFNVK